ncbi:hypothetical protein [Streptomyces scopuliridis]|uniref:hypothetical protein n=1 Tax=Streptomyces scopuliridis TaxID=452529 RepID=UPI0035DA3173
MGLMLPPGRAGGGPVAGQLAQREEHVVRLGRLQGQGQVDQQRGVVGERGWAASHRGVHGDGGRLRQMAAEQGEIAAEAAGLAVEGPLEGEDGHLLGGGVDQVRGLRQLLQSTSFGLGGEGADLLAEQTVLGTGGEV